MTQYYGVIMSPTRFRIRLYCSTGDSIRRVISVRRDSRRLIETDLYRIIYYYNMSRNVRGPLRRARAYPSCLYAHRAYRVRQRIIITRTLFRDRPASVSARCEFACGRRPARVSASGHGRGYIYIYMF